MASGETIVLPGDPGVDSLVNYYNGSLDSLFGVGFTDDFLTCEERVIKEFVKMPPECGKLSPPVVAQVADLVATYRK